MNDRLKEFIANVGVMCETWTIVYKKFIGQGMNVKDALTHTQYFMTALFAGNALNNGGSQ